MRLALAIASFVVLIVHGVVFYDQFFHRWERHQTAYFEQARSLSKNEGERAELEARSPRIEQTIVTSFGDTRVDRCTTCHIASDDPRFAGHAQPLKSHPYSAAMGDVQRNGRWERRHKFADFGCTVCHDGQGRGLETKYSHGEDEFWPEPLTGYVTQATWRKDFAPKLKSKDYIEANCAQCHTAENFAGTPHVNRGRKLFYAMNCYGCHKIDGMSEGTLGPDLTEAGKKFKIDYLWESIVEAARQPGLQLHAEVQPVRRGREGAGDLPQEPPRRQFRGNVARSLQGARRERRRGDSSGNRRRKGWRATDRRPRLHRLSQAGHIATAASRPTSAYEGLIRDNAWLMDHFTNPRSRVPDSIMPTFRFPEEDFQRITAYLASLKTPPPAMSPAETYKALCERCHGEKGDGEGKVAWYLDPAPRDLDQGRVHELEAARTLRHLDPGRRGRNLHALLEERPASRNR